MIHDKLENLIRYIPAGKRAAVQDFLEKLSEDTEEGTYGIDGPDIYAKIMSYPTKERERCAIEAHDLYCDIQFSLTGEEGISVYPRELLIQRIRDPEADFMTLESGGIMPAATVCNRKGYFTLIHPWEAHRPQESPDGTCAAVKKGVIKIKESLL